MNCKCGNNISQIIEEIKRIIRSKYKSKINNYIHDICIHACDNFKQTNQIEKIMEKYKKFNFINLKYFIKCNFTDNIQRSHG